MEITKAAQLISDYGFPIVCVVALAWFALYMVKQSNATNAANMEAVQKRCKEREDKLYEEIKQNREINAKAIETIAHYAEKLDGIQEDVHEMKRDIIIIKERS